MGGQPCDISDSHAELMVLDHCWCWATNLNLYYLPLLHHTRGRPPSRASRSAPAVWVRGLGLGLGLACLLRLLPLRQQHASSLCGSGFKTASSLCGSGFKTGCRPWLPGASCMPPGRTAPRGWRPSNSPCGVKVREWCWLLHLRNNGGLVELRLPTSAATACETTPCVFFFPSNCHQTWRAALQPMTGFPS